MLRDTNETSIPTSPMADIAFLLIIFFMVTSVFSATKELELVLPEEEVDRFDPEPEQAVFIHVQPDRILVDCREMAEEAIRHYLEPKLLRDPNKHVILYTDADAEYRRMVSVYDALAGSGNGAGRSSFGVRNLSVPTRSDLQHYEELFGENPFEAACR